MRTLWRATAEPADRASFIVFPLTPTNDYVIDLSPRTGFAILARLDRQK
jgi:hypothetical protein